MYMLSVPLIMDTLTDKALPVYLDYIQKSKAQRVFIAFLGNIFEKESVIYTRPEWIEKSVNYFRSHGLEVGIWVNALGHGSQLVHETSSENTENFTLLEGVYGDKTTYGYCPMDSRFSDAYADGIRQIASLHPDIIMLDDDFRLNVRSYYMGCFCPGHLKEYYKRIGEEIPRDKIENLIFIGGRNKYRSEYMKLSADTLLDFAKKLRKAVDEVDESIRLGACSCFDNWDFCGTDSIELAKAFAGNTKPFMRTSGAPYWSSNIIDVIENTRMQLNWCANTDVEVFAEGDTYPRPRYNIPSNVLELFDLALLADGSGDGILKYMFDYARKPEYESGYINRHIKNESLRNQVSEIFSGKTPVGVRSYNVMHKIENWLLPEICQKKIADKLINSYKSVSRNLLSKNSIPTAFGIGDYPVLLCGENARYIDKTELKNGALVDIPAAKILQERGIDTGLISEKNCSFTGEYFVNDDDCIGNIDSGILKKITCSERTMVLSKFIPDNTPASYLYENDEGMRFFVLAYDLYDSVSPDCFDFCDNANKDYMNNYYRQAQLIEAAQWAGRKKLPAVCTKNPNLYILASSGENAMSVALINVFLDEVLNPEIKLDRSYSEIRFVNCIGRLEGNSVYLSDISPYGFAAFEVK